MRNTFTTLCIATGLMFSALTTSAQEEKQENLPGFHKGSNTLGIAVGVGVSYGYTANAKSLPALAVVLDHGFKDMAKGTIGIGGIIGYKGASYDYGNAAGDKAKWTNIIVAARGTYHFHIKNQKLDPYLGIMAGIRYTGYSDTYLDKFPLLVSTKYDGIFPAIGGFAGARYSFNAKSAVFAELGYDISFLKIGYSLGL